MNNKNKTLNEYMSDSELLDGIINLEKILQKSLTDEVNKSSTKNIFNNPLSLSNIEMCKILMK